MTAAQRPGEPRLDERLMPAGTNARFALVVILALVTSAKMVLEFAFSYTGEKLGWCELAAGIDIYRPNPDVNVLLARLTQAAAYTNCESRYAAPPPWWLSAGWPLLVLVVAVFVFYADFWWKTRGSRVRPIGEFDDPVNGFVLSQEIQRLARKAGVPYNEELLAKKLHEKDAAVRLKHVVVDVTSAAQSATVLGSNRRPVLCLHHGLVAQRLEYAFEGKQDPKFNAVLLHEFAHIRSGDVTAARATMAVWRSFLLVALIPYLVIYVIGLAQGSVAGLTDTGAVAVLQRDVVTSLALACLGYLARSDVLRNREIYADREAERNGANKDCWPASEDETPSWTERVARAFAELWRSHPSWGLRARSLDDPVVLFTVQALPVFLAGAAAALIDADFQYVVQVYGQRSTWIGSQWMWQGTGALSAALVTLIVGVGLWRLVAYSRQAGRSATGLRTGLWLGAGMIAGDLAAGQGTLDQLLPSRPEMFLLVLAAGTGFSWWTVQCAGTWLVRWRGRIPRGVMTAGLAGGFLVLSWWFTWWADAGSVYSTGITFSLSGLRRVLVYSYVGPAVHPAVLTVAGWFWFFLGQLALPPVDLLAVAAAWVVPLLAWTRRPAAAADSLPSLRWPLAWATVGAAATWGCVIWAQAYMHQTQPPRPPLHGLYELTYSWLILGAQIAPAALVALAVGLWPGRFRLLVTLIATEVTVLAGLAGTFVLVSADGCVRSLATLETSCSWRPGLIKWVYPIQVDDAAVATALLAFVACLPVLVLAALRRDDRAGRAETVARVANRKALVIAGITGATALGVALVGIVMKFPLQSHYVSAANQVTSQVEFGMSLSPRASAPPPPQDAALEVEEWSDLGGAALLSRLQSDAGKISPVLNADYARQHTYTVRDFQTVEPRCADILALSRQSNGYFVVPDGQARPWWSEFMDMSEAGAQGCESAISLLPHEHFGKAFWTALNRSFRQIGTAYVDSKKIEGRIETMYQAGGIVGYENNIAGQSLNVLPSPAGTRDWPAAYTGDPMDLDVYVQKSYSRNEWASAESWFARLGFVSAAREGWYYPGNSRASIIVVQFSDASGATSEFDYLANYDRRNSKPGSLLTDRVDGGVGRVIPASKKTAFVTTAITCRLDRYVIEVEVYTWQPDPEAAKSLLRGQYNLVANTGT